MYPPAGFGEVTVTYESPDGSVTGIRQRVIQSGFFASEFDRALEGAARRLRDRII